jgi:hypothetical protein
MWLYIIRNGPPSYDSYDYDGMSEEVGYVAKKITYFTKFFATLLLCLS